MKDIEIYGRDISDTLRKISVDSGGRLRPSYNLRDITSTASATMANNKADNATTLLAGDTTYFNDIVYVSASNASTNAVRLVFRDGTGGTDLFSINVGANSVEELSFKTPWPQSEKGQLWQVDFGVNANIADANDVTNTTVNVFAQIIKNS